MTTSIPEVLRTISTWIVWKYHGTGSDKRKLPYVGVDKKTDVWSLTAPRLTFAEASALVAQGGWEGMGLVVSPMHQVAVLDLDGCRNPSDGALAPWAAKIVSQCNSYTEVSPSGTGLKVFVKVKKNPTGPRKRKWVPLDASPIPGVDKSPGLEVFLTGGYCAVTGQLLDADYATVNDASAVVDEILASAPAPQHRVPIGDLPPPRNMDLSDDEVLALMQRRRQKAYHKFYVVGYERASDEGQLSERDRWLAGELSRLVGGDVDRIKTLMYRSLFARDGSHGMPKDDKWEKNSNYLNGTIQTALAGLELDTDDTVTTYKRSRTLKEISRDPNANRLPEPVIPRLGWRGRLTVFSAPDKGGKSTILAAGVAALTSGQPFLGDVCNQMYLYNPANPTEAPEIRSRGPGTVLWGMLEEHVNDLYARATRFYTNDEGLHVLENPANPAGNLYEEAKRLRPDLIVVDTLVEYAKDDVTESGASAQWRKVMANLLVLARELDAAVVVLHHARRSDGKARDSGDITAKADIILEQEQRPSEGGIQSINVRGRWTQPSFKVRLIRDAAGDKYELATVDQDACTKVWTYVKDHPGAGTNEIEKAIDLPRNKFRRSLELLRASDNLVLEKGGRGKKDAWVVAPGSDGTVDEDK